MNSIQARMGALLLYTSAIQASSRRSALSARVVSRTACPAAAGEDSCNLRDVLRH
jgi:hypothetical protein